MHNDSRIKSDSSVSNVMEGEEKGTIGLLVACESDNTCENESVAVTQSDASLVVISAVEAVPVVACPARLEYLDTFRGFIMLVMVRILPCDCIF